MDKKVTIHGAAIGATAAVLALVSGRFALASPAGAVNAVPIAPAASQAPPSFANLIQRVAPAVVSIDVESKGNTNRVAQFGGGSDGGDESGDGGQIPPELRRFFGQGQGHGEQAQRGPMRATGSGFFVSADGYIVTNNHVVEGADKVTVRTADDRTLNAKVIGRDPETDLAVIKVEGHNLPFVSFADRAKPRVGDWVVAVGNPFNLGGTATAGIVSALARPQVSGSGFVDYMQIDAPINRGNSGGPTFDLEGRVVGVNSALFSPSGGSVGIGFDIPADVAASVSRQLIANGKVSRGYIGATVQDVTPEIGESLGVTAHHGALVADVVPDGPSARAGLHSGDLIVGVDGHPVTSSSDLTRQVALVRSGEDVRLEVRRDGAMRSVAVRSGLRPSEAQLAMNDTGAPGASANSLGLRVAPHPGGGVMIEGVSPNSSAAERGLQTGDVIERVGEHATNSPSEVSAAVASAKSSHHKEVLLLIARGGQHLFLPVEITPEKG
jgi:serine protease Do